MTGRFCGGERGERFLASLGMTAGLLWRRERRMVPRFARNDDGDLGEERDESVPRFARNDVAFWWRREKRTVPRFARNDGVGCGGEKEERSDESFININLEF